MRSQKERIFYWNEQFVYLNSLSQNFKTPILVTSYCSNIFSILTKTTKKPTIIF